MNRTSPPRVLAAALVLASSIHEASTTVIGWSPGLRSQLQRAADAIAANIAEGSRQTSPRQRCRYLEIALGSADEVGVHLRFAVDRRCITKRDFLRCEAQRVVVCRMLIGLLRAIDHRSP